MEDTRGKAAAEARIAEITAVVRSLPQVRALGIEVEVPAHGRCRASLEYRAGLVGNPASGVLHGGVVTTLLDTAAGVAVYAGLAEAAPVATLDMRIDYLKPARPRERLIAEAELYRLTRHVAFVRARAHQDDPEDHVAHCVAAFMIGSVGFPVEG